jgi:anti-sigma regulatory factor (Ser/Thr protein kinase)
MLPTPVLHRFYAAVPPSIPSARTELADFAARSGVGEDQLHRIRLSVSEALTNVVEHAYENEDGQIELFGTIADGELWVLVADEGRGFRQGHPSEGLGLGLVSMALFSDGLTIANRSWRGLEVRMRFSLDSGSGSRGLTSEDHWRRLRQRPHPAFLPRRSPASAR